VELKKLLKLKKVRKSGLYFSLCDFPDHPYHPTSPDLPSLRLLRQSFSAKKLMIAKKAARLLSHIPTIQLICVTGSLAMENCDESDDIDLMIVTSANSLWLTRLVVVFLLSIFFKRRKPPRNPSVAFGEGGPNHPNALCLNLWLDTTALQIPKSLRSLRVAHELAQMKPILNKNQTYEKMLSANSWLKAI